MISRNSAIEIFGRVLLLYLYGNLVRNHILFFIAHHKSSSLLYVIMESLLIGLVIFRKPALRFSLSPIAWLVAFISSLLPLLIQPTINNDHYIWLLMQLSGMVITLLGIISLNRSFGIVPADRGIKSEGMYKIVRHPLYLGYTISYIAILFNQFSRMNCIYISSWFVVLIIRILMEEKFLSQNPEYRKLMEKTRWRLIPYIW